MDGVSQSDTGEAEAEGDPLASGPLASGYDFPLTVSQGDTVGVTSPRGKRKSRGFIFSVT